MILHLLDQMHGLRRALKDALKIARERRDPARRRLTALGAGSVSVGAGRFAAAITAVLVLLLAVALLSAWSALALWFRLPGPEWARGVAAFLFAILGAASAVLLFTRRRWPAFAAFALAFGALIVWWSTIKPPTDGDWTPDVARQTTGALQGDVLTLSNVREFEWRSDSDFTERWSRRSYDLSKLKTLDLFLAYWAGPQMAHLIMSFGFEGGDISPGRSRSGARRTANIRRLPTPSSPTLSSFSPPPSVTPSACARMCAVRMCASTGSTSRPIARACCCLAMSTRRTRWRRGPGFTIRSPPIVRRTSRC